MACDIELLSAVRLTSRAGDISYARGTSMIWEQYFALIEPVSTRIPYMVSIGNHGLASRWLAFVAHT